MSKGDLTKIGEAEYLELENRLVGQKHWNLKIKGRGTTPRLLPPRTLEGIYENTFEYNPHHDWSGEVGLLHTSWLPVEHKWRNTGTDSIWPLITEYGKVVYFGEPCDRTPEGIIEAYTYTLIIEHIIDNRPTCSYCNRMMHIKRIYGTKEYVHVCQSSDHPGRKVTRPFGFSLPQELKDFLTSKREATERYFRENERKGIYRKLAAMVRKKWILLENKPLLQT